LHSQLFCKIIRYFCRALYFAWGFCLYVRKVSLKSC
jgi:hypothetical protein